MNRKWDKTIFVLGELLGWQQWRRIGEFQSLSTVETNTNSLHPILIYTCWVQFSLFFSTLSTVVLLMTVVNVKKSYFYNTGSIVILNKIFILIAPLLTVQIKLLGLFLGRYLPNRNVFMWVIELSLKMYFL